MHVIDAIFCGLFTVELALRIACYRMRFFQRIPGWQWNVFDTIVVVFQLVEEVARSASVHDLFDSLGVLRILRLARTVRIIRMVRLVRELKSMVYLLCASMWSFFWTVMLLLIMMFFAAVYFTELACEIHQSKIVDDPDTLAGDIGW